jgi:tripartite-type tricarboxylate transporter receptor subunit TctC
MNSYVRTLSFFAALSCIAAPLAVFAQAYPSKPIRIIMAVGGGAEVVTRLTAQKMSEDFGQPVLVEIQAGAAGAIGADLVARAAPDGYTLLLAGASSQIMRPFLAKNTPYDPIKSFTPIIRVAEAVMCVMANPSLPMNSLKELVDYAKRNPGKISYASSGIGTNHHLSAELVKQVAGIDMVHVPYKGGADVLTGLVSGQVPVAFGILATAASQVKSGKIKILAINNAKRYSAMPDIPTVSEQVPGYEPAPGWMGYLGPAGLARPVLGRLHTELVKVLAQPDIRAKAEDIGFTIETGTSEEFAAAIKRDLAIVGKIVKAAGIQPE